MDVERAFLFVDGSNFYHALHDIGLWPDTNAKFANS